jgi:NAD(P)-dependent dehydrogenase (short-subunit alcohol dehydrogenase family)
MPETVIITGGSKGLGRAMVEYWLNDGWNVATCARDISSLAALQQQYPESLCAVEVDVASIEQVKAFCASAIERFKYVSVLVNNASVLGPRVTLEEYFPEEFEEVMRVNTLGSFNFIHELVPHFKLQRAGVILNISSGAGVKGGAKWGAYAASKFAIEGLTQVLKEEVFDDKIRVHAIDPGAMRTQMRAAAYPSEDPLTLPTPEQIARVIFDIAAVYEPTMTRLKAKDYL